MEPQQNATRSVATSASGKSEVAHSLTWQQEEYISFVALGGMLPVEDNSAAVRKVTTEEMAAKLCVDRVTMWRWRKIIPDFWKRVDERRKELGGKDRLSKAWNGIWLKTVAGNAEAGKLYFANFDPNFRMPMQKIEHELGDSWTALLAAKREVIEGEVVDGSDTD